MGYEKEKLIENHNKELEEMQTKKTDKVRLKKFSTYDKKTLVMHMFDEAEKKIFSRLATAIIFLNLILMLIIVLMVVAGVLIIINLPNIEIFIKDMIANAVAVGGG